MSKIIKEEPNPPTTNIYINASLVSPNNIIEEVSNTKNNTPTVNIIEDELYTEESTKAEMKKEKASRQKKALSTDEIVHLILQLKQKKLQKQQQKHKLEQQQQQKQLETWKNKTSKTRI